MYQKPLSYGHLAIRDKMLVPNGVRYRGVPLHSAKTKITSVWLRAGNSAHTIILSELVVASSFFVLHVVIY